MNNEQQLNNQNGEENKQGSFVDILYVLRSHLIFIIVVTILFGIGGYIYGRLRQPVYTASVPVEFDVEITDSKGVDQISSTNYLFAYLDTAIGVCEGGEVIDRANVYYNFYLKSEMKIDDFINHVYGLYTDEVQKAHQEIPGYEVTEDLMNEYRDKWFTAENVGTIYNKDEKEPVINFKLWVRNLNAQYAKEMARIYALAADVSLNKKVDFGGTATAGIIELNKTVSGVGVSSDMSMSRVILVAVALGILVSLVAIYVMYLLDNTIKSKEMLENMTGSSVIAYIDDVSEVRNG